MLGVTLGINGTAKELSQQSTGDIRWCQLIHQNLICLDKLISLTIWEVQKKETCLKRSTVELQFMNLRKMRMKMKIVLMIRKKTFLEHIVRKVGFESCRIYEQGETANSLPNELA